MGTWHLTFWKRVLASVECQYLSHFLRLLKVMNVSKLGPFCVNWPQSSLGTVRGVNGCERCLLMWAVARRLGTWDPISSLSKDTDEYKMQMGEFIFWASLFFWNQSAKKKFALRSYPILVFLLRFQNFLNCFFLPWSLGNFHLHIFLKDMVKFNTEI